MISVREQVSLAPYTTLGVGGNAEYFTEVTTHDELREAVSWAKERLLPVTILGGGSNVLVRDGGVKGLVIRIRLTGIVFEAHGSDEVSVIAEAGVIFDELIAECVEKGLWGLENLSAIPGTVGATPVQNVGAYGVEVKDVIKTVTAYSIETDTFEDVSAEACMFGYRNSLFKSAYRDSHVIVSVTFKLSRAPKYRLEYKDLRAQYPAGSRPSLADIRKTVMTIRAGKFPDWTHIGTAGSFFKNPTISHDAYAELQKKYPDIPGYAHADGTVKIALGWVLDQVCGLRGVAEHGVGLFDKQALVLVCKKGGVTADAVEVFSQNVIDRVFQKTGIVVEREVNIIGEK